MALKSKPTKFRFRGLRNDGKIIESNDINDFRLQDFHWFEEIVTMTQKDFEKLYGHKINQKTK